jgi:malate dehydrogenase (oxaloacetate-decarboxylating)(NADP+)
VLAAGCATWPPREIDVAAALDELGVPAGERAAEAAAVTEALLRARAAGANRRAAAAGVVNAEMVKSMGTQPLILALANPEPEIRPEIAKAARPDCIIATGRSDYPNQVNNVLCFPFIFRGALDARAKRITPKMKLAAAYAIAECMPFPTRDMNIPPELN